MTLAPDAVRSMFDRIAPVYDAMNRVMTAGLDLRWRRLAAAAAVRPGDRVLDAACGTGDLALADLRAGAAAVTGLDFSARMLERARRKAPSLRWIEGDLLALPFEAGTFDAATVGFGVRNVADLERALASSAACCVRAAGSRSSRSRARAGALRAVLRALVRPRRARGSGGSCRAGPPTRYLPASVARFPAAEELAGLLRARRLRRRRVPAARRLDRRAPHRDGRVNALASVDATPGPRRATWPSSRRGSPRRSAAARASPPGVAGEALAAGGKRLRPLLCFLSSPDAESEPPLAAGVATELVHMATLVHDDLVDGARMRRGAPAAWSVFGAGAALAAGDYLFACAFAELAATEDSGAVAILADACLALARGEAMQRQPDARRRRPRSTPTSSAAR